METDARAEKLLRDRALPGGDDRHKKAARRSCTGSWTNHGLVRMSPVLGTIAFTVLIVIVAEVTNFILGITGLTQFDAHIAMIVAIATTVITVPFAFYSQTIIGNLRASRQTLRLMTNQLAKESFAAERANAAKSDFLTHMSHELRTPLNAIIGFSDIMKSELLGPMPNAKYLGYTSDIHNSGTHLLSIINSILDLAKIEAGRDMVEVDETFDMATAINTAVSIVGPLAEEQQVNLHVDLPTAAINLVAVPRMIRQIMVNILSNALKFTPKNGSVFLRAAVQEKGDLAISITDTGIGMSAENIKTAIIPFGQINSNVSRKHAGTGLGLPLAKAMLELHGGNLVVHSKIGEGTTVQLVIPAERVSKARKRRASDVLSVA